MKKFSFIFLMVLISSANFGWAQCSDIFFSEYIEGSSNNKGIEIYNPSDVAVDLSNYQIYMVVNGGPTTNTFDLTGMLAPGDVYVITADQADAVMQAQADTVLAFPSVIHFNGDDAVALVNLVSTDTIDIIGVLGVDPGSSWPVDTGSTQNYTLVRMASIQEGTNDWSVGATQWTVYPEDTFDSLGSHSMNPCEVTGPNSCAVDLFFSEYIEGSSNNKGIEIYNPFDTAVDLTNYQVYMVVNGGPTTNTFDLTGMLAPGDVYVITTDQADAVMQAQADTVLAFPSIVHFNGDDAIALVNLASSDTVDIIGVLGVDPGSSWPVDTGSTQNYTLVRMPSVQEGTTDWSIGATQWIVFPEDYFDSLGMHYQDPCPVGPEPSCIVDLFISEYIEGSGNNKGIEIYNPLDVAVDLSNYQVYEVVNGGSAINTFDLVGTLAPGDVYVITTDQADAIMQAQADTVLGFPSIVHFNGDDGVSLVNLATGDTIDIIGELGIDPGSNWPVGSGSTQNNTLVRSPYVQAGTTDWTVGATQWIVLPEDTFDSLGMHTMFPCGTMPPPVPDTATVSFASETATASEGDGTTSFTIDVADFSDSMGVDVVLNVGASTATNGVDFTWTDTTIVFPDSQTTSITLTIGITDDSDVEGDETIVFDLVNVTTGFNIGIGTLTITLVDNDYPIYSIGLITDDADGDGLGDSVGVSCQVQGIVHGVDLQESPAQTFFTVIDSTGGIGIFSGNDTSYTVTEGDEVIIRGTISQFNGLTQFSPVDEIILVSQGNPTFTPLPVTVLDETTESEIVKLECVAILDTIDITSSGYNLRVSSNGIDTFLVRIDKDVDLFNGPAPTAKWLDIIGIGGQFDATAPYTEGYQLGPRYTADLIERPNPVVSFAAAAATYDESDASAAAEVSVTGGNPDSTTVTVVLGSTGTATTGTDFDFSDTTFTVLGCGDSTVSLPLNIVDDTDVEGDETIVLIITTVTNGDISIDTLTVTITETDAIRDLLPSSAIKLYPNPGKVNIQWEATLNIEKMTISNLMGQEIISVANPEAHGQMNISHLPAGVYIIRMETKEGLWMQKWMKE